MNEELAGLLALLGNDPTPPFLRRPMVAPRDATRVAVRPQPTALQVAQTAPRGTMSAYAPNHAGGLVWKAREMLGLPNIPQEPGLLGKIAEFVGLNEPASMIDGPARAMAAVGKVGKVEKIVSAAVMGVDGKPYPGSWHGEAADLAEAAGVGVRDASGFLTSTGRYVTGEEADAIARRAKQIDPKSPQGALRSEEIEELYARQLGIM